MAEGHEAASELRRDVAAKGEGGGGEGGGGGGSGAVVRGDPRRGRRLQDVLRGRRAATAAAVTAPGPERAAGVGIARRHRAVGENEAGTMGLVSLSIHAVHIFMSYMGQHGFQLVLSLRILTSCVPYFWGKF